MPVLENFRPTFSPDPTDCPWVSEDARVHDTVARFLTGVKFSGTTTGVTRAGMTFCGGIMYKTYVEP